MKNYFRTRQTTGDNTGYTQKNGAVSKVNKKFISHPTRVQRTPSAVRMRSELLVVHEKIGQLLLLTVYVVPL